MASNITYQPQIQWQLMALGMLALFRLCLIVAPIADHCLLAKERRGTLQLHLAIRTVIPSNPGMVRAFIAY